MSRVRIPSIAHSSLELSLTHWLAFFLGLIQGATEFLPISSSGHLQLAKVLFGLENLEGDLLFDVTCHLGTALAILLVLRRDVAKLFSFPSQPMGYLILGTLPLVLIVPLATRLANLSIQWLGLCFLGTAGIIFAGEKWASPERPTRWPHALWIGAAQTLALIPGISRSGSTISAARWMGWTRSQAVRFSFLLSLPAVAGATLVEGWRIFRVDSSLISSAWTVYAVGFSTAFVVGLFSLRAFLRWVERTSLRPFGWYCVGIGLVAFCTRLAG